MALAAMLFVSVVCACGCISFEKARQAGREVVREMHGGRAGEGKTGTVDT
jgi:hypothetical protein